MNTLIESSRKQVTKNPLEHGVCPNPLCKWHHKFNLPQGERWYKNHGFYTTKQHEKIPRYVCNNCGRTFTLRTGAKHWYLRDDSINLLELGNQWANGSKICEMAKAYGVSTQVIKTRLKRYHWKAELSTD